MRYNLISAGDQEIERKRDMYKQNRRNTSMNIRMDLLEFKLDETITAVKELKSDVKELKSEIRASDADFKATVKELKSDIAASESRLKGDIAASETRWRWTVGTAIAFLGLMFAVFGFYMNSLVTNAVTDAANGANRQNAAEIRVAVPEETGGETETEEQPDLDCEPLP